MNLRWRITWLMVLGVAIAVGVGSGAATWSARRTLEKSTDRLLTEQAIDLEAALTERRSGLGDDAVGQLVGATDLASMVRLGEDGLVHQVVAGGEAAPVGALQVMLPTDDVASVTSPTDNRMVFSTVDIDGTAYRLATRSAPAPFEAVQVAQSTMVNEEAINEIESRLAGITLVATAIAALCAWLVMRREMKPFERLGSAVNNIADTGDFGTRVTVDGTSEVQQLGTNFNALLATVQESREQQHRLVVDAGHELRTPLTSLRTSLELLADDGLDEEDVETLRRRVRFEYLELISLADALVQLGTEAASAEPSQPCDLAKIAAARVRDAQRRHGARVVLDSVAAAPILGRPELLGRAVHNLLENAVKFSPADSTVSVRVTADSVEVLDEGPGFEFDERDRVFDRFYRSPRLANVAGSGLGLSIVKYAADAHRGGVYAENRSGGGARVGFRVGRG